MPFSSPCSYAANNPVVLVDVDGLAPGGGTEVRDSAGSDSERKAKNESRQLKPEDSDRSTALGVPVFAQMGYSYRSIGLMFGAKMPTNNTSAILLDDAATVESGSYWYITIGVWRQANPDGSVGFVHPPIFSSNGEFRHDHQRDLSLGAKLYFSRFGNLGFWQQ